nr:MAG TPA: hypothetical protein [Caudoviricetes sp.]
MCCSFHFYSSGSRTRPRELFYVPIISIVLQ